MLSGQHFYHRITRKMVVAFGTMFNNIKLYRYNLAGTQEIERVIVPLNYITKEKFYQRITQDPNLDRRVQLTLPRMSFEMTSIAYDTSRKISPFMNQYGALNDSAVKAVTLAPYNFSFQLYIYVRNTEDGTQIIEQILPYFNPDYTMTLDLVGVGNPVDVPLILQSIDYNAGGSDGPPQELRMLQWNLGFTMRGYLYGPQSNVKIIRKSTANTYAYNTGGNEAKSFALSTGEGEFKIGELVYQGRNINGATATGFISSWSNTSNTLVVSDLSGSFEVGKFITGAVSNASYNLSTYRSATDYQLNNITVIPDPLSANVGDAFGFDVSIETAPNIT
jgi:hypothetical protein